MIGRAAISVRLRRFSDIGTSMWSRILVIKQALNVLRRARALHLQRRMPSVKDYLAAGIRRQAAKLRVRGNTVFNSSSPKDGHTRRKEKGRQQLSVCRRRGRQMFLGEDGVRIRRPTNYDVYYRSAHAPPYLMIISCDVLPPDDEELREIPLDVSWNPRGGLEPRKERVGSESIHFHLIRVRGDEATISMGVVEPIKDSVHVEPMHDFFSL